MNQIERGNISEHW